MLEYQKQLTYMFSFHMGAITHFCCCCYYFNLIYFPITYNR